ncbi:MAG TPA: thioredoxin domain-containing protein [Myxococcota bacterium]|nr:thioredoxin domain-containing protein [Myxococcota bacterium]
MKKISLVLILVLGIFGAGVGGLMTWHHDTQLYGTAETQGELIGCTESAEVNCDIVNTSEWSELGGVPLGTLAIPFYTTLSLLAFLGLRGRPTQAMLLVGGIFSVALSGLLYYISTSELHYVCAWCLRLYGVNAAVFVLALLAGKHDLPDGRTFGTGAGAFLVLLGLAAGGERAYRSSLGGGELGVATGGHSGAIKKDPTGKLPLRSITVTTEEGSEATFSLEEDDAWKGNLNAQVTVVEFADLECGYCKRTASELSRLYDHYGDRVLFVFKHYPMNPSCNEGVKNNKHRDACRAAAAAVCSRRQGYFWPFHDLAFKNQHQLGDEFLRTYAQQAGVPDMAAWSSCVKDPGALAEVRQDASVGASLNIRGTPRIFIQGKLYRSGTSAEAMARAIELALGTSAEDAAKAASSLKEQAVVAAAVPADVPEMRSLQLGDLSFRIDSFEAGVADGKATSGKHQIPGLRMSWYAAKEACEKAGKRLCTEREWVSACQGAPAVDDNKNGEYADDLIEGTAYPYADFHNPSRCWDGKDREQFRPVYTGEMPGCVTASGVYDMTGNVEEWVGESPEKAVLLGGAWDTTEDHARCYRRNDTFGAGYASPRTGFRCCANP